MKLALQLGYWGATPPGNAGELVAEAERLGWDAVFAAESWGSDAFTPLAWWGSATNRIRLGTSVAQLSARTPTGCAMHALTLDHLTGGRFTLGLGVSGPQVVEGWYGQPFARPLARTREYVSIVRQVLAREAPVRGDGPHYPLPYRGERATGLGKPLRAITHPLRADLPILLGAEGPRNVALAAEIADGWLAVYYSPRLAEQYNTWLDEGFGARDRTGFEVVASAQVIVTDQPERAVADMKPVLALYIGGMGAPELNFHAEVFRRMGYAAEVAAIGRLFREGDRERAAAAVPDELVHDIAIIGTAGHVREQVARWARAGVTTLLVGCRGVDELRALSEVWNTF
ncbi:LLM class F420-dependent oxidoreductase [Kutzneria albida]|uniref:Fmn-dependent monooxygenase n=1 Tax=Kutzneria albida DSM 43870 TaxID=1449976 RepID=W5W791_9PSEU|nr:LLM class F420-dependent oxidoreductase [Kutzneria albida]AHH96767.1 fmn-dependent monooxygenase [Kutzneria albida DSM 43870]